MDPEYLSGSPTVMAYDYATGDYFSPAYLGQQTPAQAAFAAAKAAEPILANMPATAPLVAHPVPGYPKQGHVPHFDMPMNKGDWNIKGVGIPTFSPALPPIPGSAWPTSPMPIDGAQLDAGRPQFSAYAGASYGAAQINYAKPALGQAREVQDGGYRYRQFADGAIMVLISERPDLLAPGTILTGTNAADPNYRRWVAITAKIGAWKDYAQAQSRAAFTAIADAALKARARRPRRRKAKAQVEAPTPASIAASEPVAQTNYTPWLIGGAVALIGVVALVAMRGKKGKGSKA